MSNPFLNLLAGAVLAGVLNSAAGPALSQSKAPASEKPAAPGVKELGMENAHAMCIGCHGIPGYKTAFPSTYHVPKIAGQQPGYIIAALKAYKSGERSHPSMRGIAASLTDDDMKKLAEYYGGGK
ncbi:MAG TPA: c-type cytochrome [Burkholderiales bacterium]|nr:c-type cytochrome [Burkholderiales bacterium]